MASGKIHSNPEELQHLYAEISSSRSQVEESCAQRKEELLRVNQKLEELLEKISRIEDGEFDDLKARLKNYIQQIADLYAQMEAEQKRCGEAFEQGRMVLGKYLQLLEAMSARSPGPAPSASSANAQGAASEAGKGTPKAAAAAAGAKTAFQQLQEYMNAHNYGKMDWPTYSQDPEWRSLHIQAFPDYRLPPRNSSDNLGRWDDIPPGTSAAESLKAANPDFNRGREWKVNCQRCVPTFELRSRGYDVTALPCLDFSARDYVVSHPYNVWENAKVLKASGSGKEDIESAMKSWGDGARAQICIVLEQCTHGHTFIAEQRNGRTVFIDPQSGEENVERHFNRAAHGRTTFCRIDGLQPSKWILDCCKGVRKND